MRMNSETKLVFALEHIAHLRDLIEGNYWEKYLQENLDSLSLIDLRYSFSQLGIFWI